jgi:signal transduction histidine kinase
LAIAETFASFAGIAIKNAQSHEELRREVLSRKNAEEDLKNHREQLQLINRILRHDLMNHLAVLKSSIRIFLKKNDFSILDEALATIDKSVILINQMRELETFSKTHKHLKIFDVKKVLERIAENMPHFSLEIKDTCSVLADDSISSVFENIIRNAYLHSKTKSMKIKIEDRNHFCNIHFIDNGIGIPDEIKDNIFKESFSYGKTGNTGLGLYIVKKAVESYGGSVIVVDALPQGSEFIVSLKKVH